MGWGDECPGGTDLVQAAVADWCPPERCRRLTKPPEVGRQELLALAESKHCRLRSRPMLPLKMLPGSRLAAGWWPEGFQYSTADHLGCAEGQFRKAN